MPDFMPMLRGAFPILAGLAVFVGLVKFVQFVARRWKNV